MPSRSAAAAVSFMAANLGRGASPICAASSSGQRSNMAPGTLTASREPRSTHPSNFCFEAAPSALMADVRPCLVFQ